MRLPPVRLLAFVGAGLLAATFLRAQAADPAVAALVQQNQQLQQQLQLQQKTIDALNARLNEIDHSAARQEQELQGLRDQMGAAPPAASGPAPSSIVQEIRLSGEAGFALFNSGAHGQYPNAEFRVDEARLFIEATVWKNVFLFAEADFITRESSDEGTYLGEYYADFENLSGSWGQDDLLSVRVGRFYIPFGEEYQYRRVMENPLISHSVADIWGMDQGVELYGKSGRLQYAAAIQNGGINTLHDFNSDKALTARVGFDPLGWLHLSASAMRTGRLSSSGDQLSALWFGNGFLRTLGPAASTNEFNASLGELDAMARWSGGSFGATAGTLRYDDNNRFGRDSRHLTYYSLEATQALADPLLAAVRFSHISAPRGFPIVGQGNFSTFLFGNSPTTELTRLSLGLDYRFGPPLVLKLEYSPEWGRLLAGPRRNNEDLLSSELGVKF